MTSETLKKIEENISELKRSLAEIGDMRPGTLSTQYRKPEQKKTPFHQISYTRKGKSRSEYVRKENLDSVKKEIETYNRFRSVIEQIIDLSIKASGIRFKERAARSSSQKKS